MPTLGAFAAIIDASGRILCVRQNYGGCRWTKPGGRVEPGVDDALVASGPDGFPRVFIPIIRPA
jgi:hypothetical protein